MAGAFLHPYSPEISGSLHTSRFSPGFLGEPAQCRRPQQYSTQGDLMQRFISTLAFAAFLSLLAADSALVVKYVNGYTKRDGSYVSGHYRDTSNDGNQYNNANYLGYND